MHRRKCFKMSIFNSSSAILTQPMSFWWPSCFMICCYNCLLSNFVIHLIHSHNGPLGLLEVISDYILAYQINIPPWTIRLGIPLVPSAAWHHWLTWHNFHTTIPVFLQRFWHDLFSRSKLALLHLKVSYQNTRLYQENDDCESLRQITHSYCSTIMSN